MSGMAHVQERISAIEARFAPPAEIPDVESTGEDFGQMFQGIAAGMNGQGGLSIDGVSVAGSGRRVGSPPSLSPQMREAFEETADRYGLDVNLLLAVSWQESGFNPTAVSHAGAIGLMQLMPGTAAGLGVDPTNPLENLDGGARYLRQQIDRFGSVELGLAAYNAGPGAVQKHGGIPPFEETMNYVPKVMERWRSLDSGQRNVPISGMAIPATTPSGSGSPVGDSTDTLTPDATPALTEQPSSTTRTEGAPSADVPVDTPVAEPSIQVRAEANSSVAVDDTAPPTGDNVTNSESVSAADNANSAREIVEPDGSSIDVENHVFDTTDDVADPIDDAAETTEGSAEAGQPSGSDAISNGSNVEQERPENFETSTSPMSGQEATFEPTAAAFVPGANQSAETSRADGPVGIARLPQEISNLVRERGGEVRLELAPEGLGEISVRISLGANGEVTIEIEADNDRTATVLARLHESLEASLRHEGIDLDGFDVYHQGDPEAHDEGSSELETAQGDTAEEHFDFFSETDDIDLTADDESVTNGATPPVDDNVANNPPTELRI